MRSGIFRSKHTPTPIEKFPELEKILKLIRKLSKKEQELKSSAINHLACNFPSFVSR